MTEQENEEDDLQKKRTSQQIKQNELELILHNTEQLTPEQLDQKTEAEKRTKLELQNGDRISIQEVEDLKAASRQPHETHFGLDIPFYHNIYKINPWPIEDHKKFVKRKEVAIWTNRLIYGRFDPAVLKHMKKMNPILFMYIRRDKYFQYLSKKGQKQLDEYIADFNRMIVGYDNWDEFEADYCDKYNIDRQIKLKF